MSSRLQSIPVLKAGLTERELLSVVAAYMSLREGEGAIDWEKFIQLAGYSSVQSARICFRPVQKKLRAFAESGSGLAGRADDPTDGDDGGGGTASPFGTPKTPKMNKTLKTPKMPGSKPRGRPKKRKAEDDEVDPAGTFDFAGTMMGRPVDMQNSEVKVEMGTNVAAKMEPSAYIDENLGASAGVQGDHRAGDEIYYGLETGFETCLGQEDVVAFRTDPYEELDVVSLLDGN
ncbi:hypothetical protein CMQ_2418 [Grosmannia clavigera kw1407]|uniref:Uncharacterized protein n=1 Tax=Grosmannia clavigera (strain kw1407 / UAMH 11150) TaxID=655863 RepID=F0XIU1_GROCL|nr:uncharacterized protein CMQ_2418 [Grosmannia clavigera kw1407]EFX02369.1 hypothetical protein CMQ_2418 [Grosmannia clavigera kw1407]